MNTRTVHFWPLAAALTVGLALAVHAAPLTFQGVSPASAAAQLSARYGVQITLQNHFGSQVTFTVDDPDAPGARLQAINALANALGAEFTKTYVVRKVAAGDISGGAFDSTGKLPAAQKTTLAAADAIRLVAALDDARVKTVGDVDGTVTLSAPALPVAQAAAEVARQTGTRWLTVYDLTTANRDVPAGGKIIGFTAAGSPIIEYAAVDYPTPKPVAPPLAAGRGPGAGGVPTSADAGASTQQQLLAQQQLLQQQQQLLAQQQSFAQQQAYAQQQALSRNGGAVYGTGFSGYRPTGNGYGAAMMQYPANGLLLQGGYGY